MYTFERKANYYETDQMGIVHHSNYIRWFEEARIALMEDLGLPYDAMEKAGVLILVLGVSAEYKSPVRFNETLVLELRIVNYTGVRFEVEYTGRSKESGQLCCSGTTKHCFTTPGLKPVRLQRTAPDWHRIFTDASKA